MKADTIMLAFLIFLVVGIGAAYRDSGFLGSLIWGPALAAMLMICGLYVIIVSGGVSAITAGISAVGKVLA
jgi:hypothetical protein